MSWSNDKIRKPNIEIRNKPRKQINLKSGKSKTLNPEEARLKFLPSLVI
jgi:hypothetical protein